MGQIFSKSRKYRTAQELGLYPSHFVTTYPSQDVDPMKCSTCRSYTHIHEWTDSANKYHRIFLCHHCTKRDSLLCINQELNK